MDLKIDTSKWKEFRVGDVFLCSTTKPYKSEELDEGKTLYISRSALNNGCCGKKYADDNVEVNLGGCITIGAEGKVAFYQPFDFISGIKIYTLRCEFLNQNTGLFICAILNKSCFKYTYGRARILGKIKDEIIKLPVKSDNTPDWQYMNDYIEAITNKKRSNGQTLAEYIKTANKHQEQPLNTDAWKVFKLSDLFEIETGADLIYREQEAGEICVIGHNAENHGVTCKIKLLPNREKYNHSKTISLGDRGNFIAYTQPCDFYIGTRVKALISRNDKANIYSLMFISTVINKEQYKFSYGRNATDKTPDIEIKLPQTPEGNPDYEYMENYIKTLPYADKI